MYRVTHKGWDFRDDCTEYIKNFLNSYFPEVTHLFLAVPEAEFNEFEPRLTFMTQLKYGWFGLKLYSMFQDLSRHSIETGFWRIWDAAQIYQLIVGVPVYKHSDPRAEVQSLNYVIKIKIHT